jgi:hypothetical protein
MTQPEFADAREQVRTNMFLAAVIRSAGVSLPVKVRNMSVTGALVEGDGLPYHGAEVQLARGSLVVSGTVAWSSRGRCGLRFSSLICVRDWLAPPANGGQQRVDEAVRVLKLGAVPIPQRSAAEVDTSSRPQPAQFGRDLQRIAGLIADLSDELSSDAHIVTHHAEKLQNLDIALQTIAVVADTLTGEMAETTAAARLGNLRTSYAAALAKIGSASPTHAP